jgi:hypothetical protein
MREDRTVAGVVRRRARTHLGALVRGVNIVVRVPVEVRTRHAVGELAVVVRERVVHGLRRDEHEQRRLHRRRRRSGVSWASRKETVKKDINLDPPPTLE